MATTLRAAIDEMFATANNVFTGYAATLLGYAPDVRWPGVPLGTQPDKSRLWARVSTQIVTDEQASLANAQGIQLYAATGLLHIQLFCPRNVGASIDNGRLVAEALQNAFRLQSTSGEIWYSKQKAFELPEAEENYPINVSVQFYYKTISQAA